MSCCVPFCPNDIKVNKDISYHIFPHPEKEQYRHNEWMVAINSNKLFVKKPMLIYRQYRVCRRHFDKECFNGGCKRLLNTAVPSLYLNSSQKLKIQEIDELSVLTTKPTNLSYIEKLEDEFREEVNYDNNSINCEEMEVLEYDEEHDLQEAEENAYDSYILDDREEQDVFIDSPEEITDEIENPQNVIDEYEILDVIDVIENGAFIKSPLSIETLSEWRKDFFTNSKNILAQNVCSRIDPFEACLSRTALESTQHVFNHKVEDEGKPLTNQKNSGRCWIFAALNTMRIPFMKENKIEEFEFSQGYLFYWDKIERCHFFLNNIVETARRGEVVEDRLVTFLLSDPIPDGGQWDMICNLVNKHGLMPKKCFPESFSCESSAHMNAILKSKLREYARDLRQLIADQKSEDLISETIKKQMNEIFGVVSICLGNPPEKFVWEYYSDKNKEYQKVGPVSPIEFYEKFVKKHFNVDDKVCLVTDARPSNPYEQVFTVDCLGNVVGGRQILYNNQKVEVLMNLVRDSLKGGSPVWFGCEVSKRFAMKQGIEDLNIHDFKLVFNVDIQTTMSKGDRLLYGESAMTHAMVFTGCSTDENDVPTKFRVENSWGEDRGEKGYLIMSADWFKEFVFEIVVDKSIVPEEILDVFELTPTVLPAWDAMGNLAE